MSVTGPTLRNLHRIHRQLSDLRSRLERGPKQIQGAQANVERLEQCVAEAKQKVVQNKMATDEKDLQLRERENRIVDIKTKLNTASSNVEYQTFLEQIAADDQANSVLSDEILELLEKTTELESAVKAAEADLATGMEEFNAKKKRIDEQRGSLEHDLTRLTNELEEAEKDLPEDFSIDYKRNTKAKGEDALAPLDGEVCGLCYQMVTPQMFAELKMQKLVICNNCGCYLYLPEE